MQARIKNWAIYREYSSLRAMASFVHNLQQRGYSGRLKFKHDKHELSVKVKTDQGNDVSLTQVQIILYLNFTSGRNANGAIAARRQEGSTQLERRRKVIFDHLFVACPLGNG